MKPYGPVQVVKKWHGMRTNPVLRCLDDPEELNNRNMPCGHGPQVHELANDMRLGTTVSSQDLSEAWVTP
jgi:hypothetical protein